MSVNGKQAVIANLKKGETCALLMTVQLTEDQSGELTHTVYAETGKPGGTGELLRKEVSAGMTILPLSADFTVEKTADRTEAVPGDTITYQICIRNTGERTLHSVLSTERFLSASIQAQFVPKEGVILNSSKTQALIRELAPGQAFALLATVTLPQYFSGQELVNQVTVVSQETGTKSVQSESEITVTAPLPTPTITPYDNMQSFYAQGGGTKTAYPASSKPQTGDDTEIGVLVMLIILAVLSGTGILWYRKGKSRH